MSHVAGAIQFRNDSTGDETGASVIDKSPALAPHIHVEGRKVVEVSVEMFIQLMSEIGYYPVNPATGETVHPTDYERKTNAHD